MQNIRSKGTLPEQIIMRELQRRKIYFARHVDSIIGKPDIVFRRKKVIVFVDSDFWHGHPKRFIMPKSNLEYWKKKLDRNKKRDKEVNKILEKNGYKVIRVWEHDVKKRFNKAMNRILRAIDRL